MGESPAQYTLRSTRVVLPTGVQPADVHVVNGVVSAVTPILQPRASDLEPPVFDLRSPASNLHDLGDLVVMPGFVDTHVHVNEPGRTNWEGFETAGAAAAAGGVTTIVDMPLNCVPATTTVRALDEKRRAALGTRVHVEFWGGVVPGNASEIETLADAGVRGFKCFLTPSGVDEFPCVGEHDLRVALPRVAACNLPLLVHAEWPASLRAIPAGADAHAYKTWLDSRPDNAERDAIALLVALCREYRARIHIVHVASAAVLPLLREARAEGLALTAETCPHYLTFTAEEIPAGATEFKCAPPIRDSFTRAALWAALEDGTLDLIATDHSPSPPGMKAGGDFLRAWGGIASLELGLAAVWTGASSRRIGLDRVAQWLSTAPAALAGLGATTGAIAPGRDADVVVWNPAREWVVDQQCLHQRHKLTPYHGRRLRGRVVETYVRGRLVYRDI
ncbi:MAG TPA: allantoinase AllB [Vicinamibacterales bacterium]